MAIEKGIGAGGDAPSKAVEDAEVDIMVLPENPGVQQMDDGSVLVG